MRKITVLVAAFAMFAFAACNKEEVSNFVPDENGMVTFSTSGERYTHVNGDKQTYYGPLSQIMFDNGEALYFNGQAASITCVDEADFTAAPPANSFFGKITVPVEYVASDNVLLYPASLYTEGTAADYSDWTVSMYEDVDLLPSGEYTIGLPGFYQSWPMAAHTTGHNFVMRNTVAMLAPSLKYGYGFVRAAALAGHFPGETYSMTSLPTIKLVKVVINSDDAILTGDAHVENLLTNAPTLKMDENANAGYRIIATPVEAVNVSYNATGSAEPIMGNIPVAPIANGKHLDVNFYFAITFANNNTYYVKYNGNNVELTGGQLSVTRSKRTTLCCNLFDAESLDKCTIQSTPFTVFN